jgi:signal transduction histidine kinase/DNA-binding NarL/FixJ family response regulator
MTENQNSPLVLVADDEYHTTFMLQRIFERDGYRVECANDGISALQLARRLVPDLILLDIQMPGMNGFEVLRALRENPGTANIPTILVTAKAREAADVAHGLNLGADDYLYKPFDPRELVARAESKMKARYLEEKLHRRTQELQALLRVGEELNNALAVDDLLDLVLFLSLDLLPCRLAAIYQSGTPDTLERVRVQASSGYDASEFDHLAALNIFHTRMRPLMWPGDTSLTDMFPYGMAVPLQHGDRLLGVLLVSGDTIAYDDNHMSLFKGIGRQAALALRNAELYEIQTNYALHLEDMVAARTSELQSAQQMLIRSEKLASIGHLAASIAHEINNPLQPIRIHLEHMIEDVRDSEPLDVRAITSIQESIERITRIVSQLLEFAGRRNPTEVVQFLDLRKALEAVISLNQKLFEQNGLVIRSEIADLPLVYGSKDQLEQVFMNLILNAHAAMQNGGVLTVRAWAEKTEVVLQFEDTGSGIPAEQMNKIFDPFFSTKPTGTGLGLFVSYGIIQNHHGTIEVESTVNAGTTFTVRLPIDAQPESNG